MDHLLKNRGRLPAGHPDREVLRGRAIESCLPMAYRLASRYTGRGERLDDLRQVAALALVRAVDGYDPGRGVPFVGYAAPTIIGALKRHFRDAAWGMRVSRSSQELLLAIRAAVSDLTYLHGRAPTPAEIADHLRIDIGAIHAAKQAAQAYRLPSLNEPLDGHSTAERMDLIGAIDPHYSGVDDHLTLTSLVTALPPRERRILAMRFYDEMTQARIAAALGVSQMHVSRLLRHTLTRLRAGLLTADAPGPDRCRPPAH
ncbi:sigma-70 family RNA polymerase sigma factor [Dactylosporangium sp. NPDC049140]|uniref:sigma-70 family RNA polymerase sigma factor n=1 Tax=Dactylosporangium sp. NPDC049140 TaxID=3155647 RepID=UPI0033C57A6D